MGKTKDFRFRITATGTPECWDAMRNEITSVPHKRNGAAVEVDLTLAPLESVLLVFQPKPRTLPTRDPGQPVGKPIAVVRRPVPQAKEPAPVDEKPAKTSTLNGCAWVWYPEGDPAAIAPPGVRRFRKEFSLPAKAKVARATFFLTADNDFVLYVNGKKAGASNGSAENWRVPKKFDVARFLGAGRNVLAVQAVNATDEPSPAGLIGNLVIEVEGGKAVRIRTDKSWKASRESQTGWEAPGLDDSSWAQAKECARFGQRPWGRLGGGGGGLTASPVQGGPFLGRCTLPADLDVSRVRVFVETGAIGPEEAARITVNGAYAGGFIGKPLRLDITRHVRPGNNEIRIEPFAPESARATIYPRSNGR